jgi:hypothetical protein
MPEILTDEGVRPDLIRTLDFIMDGAQQPGRWGRRTTGARGGTMADSGGSPE